MNYCIYLKEYFCSNILKRFEIFNEYSFFWCKPRLKPKSDITFLALCKLLFLPITKILSQVILSWSCQFIDLTPSSSSQSSTLSIYYETRIPYISHHVANQLKKESPIRLARKMALKSIAWG